MLEYKKALKFKINGIVGAVVTHQHNDHAKYVHEFIASGIVVLALKDVFNAKGLSGKPFTKEITPMHGYKVGGFKILPIPVHHDVPCVGYVIEHAEMGRLLFVTDTMMLESVISGLNQIMIEANYADDILDANIENGRMPVSMRPRLLQSHMEIGTTKDILMSNDLSQVNNIVLIHLSDGNSNESRFVKEVSETTGKCVYAANKGMVIDFSKEPY